MFQKHIVNREDEAPKIDEGWWASVLADEDAFQAPHQESVGKDQSPGMYMVDWHHVQMLYDQDEIVTLEVSGCNRGGLLVHGEGIQGFVPVSHLVDVPACLSEEERREKLASYTGKTLTLKVIECEPSMERIVLSERAAQAGEGRRKQLFKSLKTGEVVMGMVTNVTDFGVFVDLGGVEGLIHVSELSWGRVQHPSDILKVGDDIKTLVLQVCEESSRVALSLKRLNENPWENLVEKYQPGNIVPAKITSIMRYGAFARLEEGIEGLIHVSSMSLPPDHKTPEGLMRVGQVVQVEILHVDVNRRRLGLGLVNSE
ncbi:MAG: S1 RNA-binding domain-containing protein [Chloroflexi bacterium]|jgi:small subunit ribosomal protein S1|nr:S1 RNA-binding domain-containing protein [Anaerolineaceae bacterium]NMB90034.1 S1 RNA-binding domain-containing protein [Chloroflexota bacterium]